MVTGFMALLVTVVVGTLANVAAAAEDTATNNTAMYRAEHEVPGDRERKLDVVAAGHGGLRRGRERLVIASLKLPSAEYR